MARIVGDWRVLGADAGAHDLRAAHEAQWLRLAQATSLLEQRLRRLEERRPQST